MSFFERTNYQVNGSGTIRLINENGEEETLPIESKKFQIETEDAVYEPAIVEEIEWENDGKQTQTSDQCGNTKRSRTRTTNRSCTIRGIAVDSERKIDVAENGKPIYNMSATNIVNNLGVAATSSQFSAASTVRMISSLYSGQISIGNTVARQVSDLISLNIGYGEELAYRFQIQLGETEN